MYSYIYILYDYILYIHTYTYGGFHKWGYPETDGFEKILLKWII